MLRLSDSLLCTCLQQFKLGMHKPSKCSTLQAHSMSISIRCQLGFSLYSCPCLSMSIYSCSVKRLHAREFPSDVSWASLSIAVSLGASNIYIRMRESLSVLAGLFLYISQCCTCLSMFLSIQRSPEFAFYYCLQSSSLCLILSLIIVYLFSNLLYERTFAQMSNLLAHVSFKLNEIYS